MTKDPERIAIDPIFDRFIHPVLGQFRFGQCIMEIDPKTGHSEICPHGFQAVWANFSTDAEAK